MSWPHTLRTETRAFALRTETGTFTLRTESLTHALRAATGAHALRTKAGAFALRTKPGPHALRAATGAHTLRTEAGTFTLRAESGAFALRAEARPHALRAETGTFTLRAKAGAFALRAEARANIRHKWRQTAFQGFCLKGFTQSENFFRQSTGLVRVRRFLLHNRAHGSHGSGKFFTLFQRILFKLHNSFGIKLFRTICLLTASLIFRSFFRFICKCKSCRQCQSHDQRHG